MVFFPAFDWAISATHPEREERLLYTRDQLAEEGLFDIPGITEYRPELATNAQVERVHFCLPSTGAVDTDSHRASAGGAITAARLGMEKKEDKAFALVRPPGHHAMRVTHGNRGFCNINNEAVMVEYIRDHYPHPTGRPLRIASIPQMKFTVPLRPGDALLVKLAFKPAEDGLGASFSLEKEKDGEAVPASRGRIAFIFR